MARLASQQVAGYFPTPPTLLPALASAFSVEADRPSRYFFEPVRLLDPCAGDGAALCALARLLTDHAVDRFPGLPPQRHLTQLSLVELERHRATAAEATVERLAKTPWAPLGEVHHGDVLRARFAGTVDLLYLNPPYDHDRIAGRLEQRFLAQVTSTLEPGQGWLLYVVPPPALAQPFAESLSREFSRIEVRRFPHPEFDAFRQLVVRAQRRGTPAEVADPHAVALLTAACAAPESVPSLTESPFTPVRLAAPENRADFEVELLGVDLPAVLRDHRPWHLQERLLGLDTPLDQLLAAPQRITLPPKPAHLALALSTGLVNGRTLRPNRPDLHPALIVKGGLERHYRYLKDRRREDGSISSAQYTQVPHLVLHALRTDTGALLTLQPGAVPSGSKDPAEWNSADVAVYYSASLAAVLREILPPLHDPTDRRRQIPYPPLARSLFTTQDHATQASLKLLAEGATPFLLGEVGTGKSTVALTLTRMLEPKFFGETQSALRAAGFPTARFRPVRSTLILCPPHLVSSWEEQIAAVRPAARVRVLNAPSDADQPADVYLLSRETAKLDSRIAGVESRACPRCGRIPSHESLSASDRAEKRLRCDLALPGPAHPLRDEVISLALAARHLLGFDARHSIARVLAGRISARLGSRISNAAEGATLSAELRAALDQRLQRLESRAATLDDSLVTSCQHLRHSLRRLRLESEDRDRESFGGSLLHLLRRVTPLPEEAAECGEPLFSRTPDPRRTPLARYVLRRMRHRIDFLIVDEAQEFGHLESAQARAAWRLLELGVPTLLLSGSIMNGYSSSLFPATWATSPAFRKLFDRTETTRFIEQFGYQRVSIQFSEERQVRTAPEQFGAMSDAVLSSPDGIRVQEAPGVTPQFLVRHLLPVAIPMHKADLDEALPDLHETRVPLSPDSAPDVAALDKTLLDHYTQLVKKTLTRIHEDQRSQERRGALWGAFAQLVYAPELFAEDCGEYAVRYPERLGCEVVATAPPLPAAYRTPKERWLLETVAAELAANRPVMVFVQSSGHELFVQRLERLLETVAPQQVIFLDAQRVDARNRKRWIDRHVIAARKNVLIVQPKAIKTGLNNLVRFKTGIWYQIPDYDVLVTRQANGRLHRIGQIEHVKLFYPYYRETLQEAALTLVSQKMTASLQVDGLSLQSALEASGAGATSDLLEGSMSFGEALARLYERSTLASERSAA